MILSAPESVSQPLWLGLLLGCVPVVAATIPAVFAGQYAKSAKASELEAQRLRELESRISERKYETYKPMIDLFGDMLNRDRAREILDTQEIPSRLHEFATWASIYASDEAVRAFRDLMQASYANVPGPIFLRLYCEFVLAARRDIGRSDTQITPEDILGMRLTDFYSPGGLFQAMEEPFDELCRKTGWTPPWKVQAPKSS